MVRVQKNLEKRAFLRKMAVFLTIHTSKIDALEPLFRVNLVIFDHFLSIEMLKKNPTVLLLINS